MVISSVISSHNLLKSLVETKSMEIVAGERASYTLLTFICLKMELHWRSNPIEKVRNPALAGPFFKESAFNNFTQVHEAFQLVILDFWVVV